MSKVRPVNRTARSVAAALCVLAALAPTLGGPTRQAISKTEFDVIDGLGRFAEVSLANELIASAGLKQAPFDPSRIGHPIASEFGIKIDGKTVVSFQIKHRRGAAREASRRCEFSNITTRLRI